MLWIQMTHSAWKRLVSTLEAYHDEKQEWEPVCWRYPRYEPDKSGIHFKPLLFQMGSTCTAYDAVDEQTSKSVREAHRARDETLEAERKTLKDTARWGCLLAAFFRACILPLHSKPFPQY
jgi:hypothetical protein